MERAGQHVRLILTSECQKDLNSVVRAWATSGKVGGQVESPFEQPPVAAAAAAAAAGGQRVKMTLLQMGSLTDDVNGME